MAIPTGWRLVPIEPTESMVVNGFESWPAEFFSDPEVWDAFEKMTGCQQAAHKARLCYAAMLACAPQPPAPTPFQQRVQPWMLACFGAVISADKLERNHRFFEEAGELVQACGMTRAEAHALVAVVLVLAATQQWDESARCASTYCT